MLLVISDVFLPLSQYVVLGWLREMCMYYNKIYDLWVLNHLIRSPDKMQVCIQMKLLEEEFLRLNPVDFLLAIVSGIFGHLCRE